jgi:elongation factor G
MEWLLCLSSQPVWPRQSRRLDCPKSLDCKELSEQALEVAEIGLLEPLTQLEVVVPEELVGVVLSDLTSTRRAQVQCLSEGVGGERTVLAQVPLTTLLGYAKDLRSMTSGSASFTMLSAGHLQMDNHQQNAVIKQIRGY